MSRRVLIGRRLIVSLVFSLLVVGVVVLPAARAKAIVARAASLELLSTRASAIVVATPVESNSWWSDRQRIVTTHHLHVTRVIAGQVPEDIWVETLGGRVGHVAQRVMGAAVLVSKQPLLVFLYRGAHKKHFTVLGMSQGVYPLEKISQGDYRVLAPKRVSRFVHRVPVSAAVAVLPRMTLRQAVRRILSLRGRRGSSKP